MKNDSAPQTLAGAPSPGVGSSDLFGSEAYNLLDRIATLLSLDLERPRVMAALTHLLESSFRRSSEKKDAEIKRLRKTLKFYANDDNWPFSSGCDSFATSDRGERARDALSSPNVTAQPRPVSARRSSSA